MATTHIKRSTSASRLVNYAEKRAVKQDGLNLDIQYAKSEFKQVRDIYGNPGRTQAYASRIAF
ncbi:relaxase/mobilization nuclease domain-containing protein [Lentilactobacillus hilgardii]|nr:relaxase/mobilization nuclease domain-containing protein [Lentilactobacillus hilgardii]